MDKRQTQISEWLEQLQRESWNLELLISGFSIFLLIQAREGIQHTINYLGINYDSTSTFQALAIGFLVVLQLAAFILTLNLLIHILMRGFWIGAIGLRSVQKKIDFNKLRYSTFFNEKLPRKVPTLDQLLINLDNFSSIIFAFTFLVIFMLISLFLSVSFIAGVGYIFSQIKELVGGTFGKTLAFPLDIFMLLLILSGLIYMLDTLSLGFFKKFKWLSRIYYPIYVLYGFVTLSFIYSGIYYSLISRFSKTRIRLFFIPYLFIVFLMPFFDYDEYTFFPDDTSDQNLVSGYYDDLRPEKEWTPQASIPSQTTSERFLPLFIRYDVRDNKALLASCTDYTPSKKAGIKSGISFVGGVQLSNPEVPEANPEKLLNCLSKFYAIYINDSLYANQQFLFYEHPNKGEKGLHTMIDTKGLLSGRQLLKIEKKKLLQGDTLVDAPYVTFPFWLEK